MPAKSLLNKPELLAPVGEWDALVAAVENGADAVYLGGQLFNARRYAANFGPEELARAVEYVHVRGVNLYVTVNILIKDSELEEVARYLVSLYELGVDGIIVQDLGLAYLAGRLVPNLPLHGSTQMTVHNAEGAKYLARLGFERVVLARELSLAEVAEIHRQTPIQLEFFVHGALCFSYSGQCLMSSLIGGRSGNRGMCAQPCRLEYTLVDKQGQPVMDVEKTGTYLLSPRDLNMSEHLPELAEAGVRSFKVEGRMKRPEYVATVIRIYRDVIDRWWTGERPVPSEQEKKDLEQIFNRGFTTGYFYGNPGRDLMSYKRPNNRGRLVGRVVGYDRERRLASVKLEDELSVGDGLEVWVTHGGRVGFNVTQIWSASTISGAVSDHVAVSSRAGAAPSKSLVHASPGEIVVLEIPGQFGVGDRIFKTRDARLIAQAEASYRSSREIRKIPVNARVEAAVGLPLKLTLTDPEGFTGYAETGFIGEEAQKRPLTREMVLDQLNRLGNTPFEIGEAEITIDGRVMVPVSEINEARRRAVAALQDARVEARRPRPLSRDHVEQVMAGFGLGGSRQAPVQASVHASNEMHLPAKTPAVVENAGRSSKPLMAVAVSDWEGLEAAAGAGADVVYIGGERFRERKEVDLLEGIRYGHRRGLQVLATFPRITSQAEMPRVVESVERLAEASPEDRPDGLVAGNLGVLNLLLTRLHRPYRPERQERDLAGETRPQLEIPVHADFTLNPFNRLTLAFLAKEGVFQAALSPELTLAQVRELATAAPVPVECLIQGPLPMMVSAHCTIGGVLGGRSRNTGCSAPCLKGTFGLKDRLGLVFPLATDQTCRMHIFNPKELCMIEHLPAFREAGVRSLRIDGRIRDAGYVEKATSLYRMALDDAGEASLEAMRQELERISPNGLTKGHYFRGVE
ncbi:MAG: DUF3656 domain-containing U32 family peptidase [Syntrophothermus sp.]